MSKKPDLRALMRDTPAQAPANVNAEPDTTEQEPARKATSGRNHGDKKPVLIHIPGDMHKALRQIALDDGMPLTQITEGLLRDFLVRKGYAQFKR
jgi:hypothetical protein